jgi:hypothetical protein
MENILERKFYVVRKFSLDQIFGKIAGSGTMVSHFCVSQIGCFVAAGQLLVRSRDRSKL